MIKAIADFLDAQADAQIAFLAELVKVPSDNPPGDCAAHGARAADLLEGLGFVVERHPVPETLCRKAGMISATNLVIRQRFGDGPTMALNAHGDVVPPGDGWNFDPYGAEIKDGWMYGRGAAVSKSDFATYAFALLALRETGALNAGTVELHFTYDEEIGGAVGPEWLLAQGISKPDMALAAGFSYEVVTHHSGCLHLEVRIKGRAAHAARPDTGADALEAATAVLTALYKYREGLALVRSKVPGIGSPSLVVGLIEGGVNTNVVPGAVKFRLDRRVVPEEDPAKAERDIRDVIATALAGRTDISSQVTRVLLANPLKPVGSADHMAAVFCRHATRVMGEPVAPGGAPLYADARLYAEAGVPTVMYGAGPRDLVEANGHRADERLPLHTLRKASEVVALSVLELLSGEIVNE